jgi:hypothetical protein
MDDCELADWPWQCHSQLLNSEKAIVFLVAESDGAVFVLGDDLSPPAWKDSAFSDNE